MPVSKKWLLGLIPPAVAALAFMLSVVSNFWCESVKFVPQADFVSSPSLPFTPQTIQLGPWYRQDTEVVAFNTGADSRFFVRQVCRAYPSESDTIALDAAWRTVRAFSVLTLLLGAVSIVMVLYNNCTYYFSATGWRILALQFLVSLPLCQGLTLLLLQSTACEENPLSDMPTSESSSSSFGGGSDGTAVLTEAMWSDFINAAYGETATCAWSSGMTCNALALVGWFCTGALMVWMGVPEADDVLPPETQQVTYARTVNPDGTITVTQTSVVKGTATGTPAVVNESPEEAGSSGGATKFS